MAAGLRAARAIGNAAALDPWRGEEVLPGPEVQDDDRVRRYLSKSLRTYSHQVGTCRIGTDEMAVVDTELRVRGINGLRVADASVMPLHRFRQHECDRLRHRRTRSNPHPRMTRRA